MVTRVTTTAYLSKDSRPRLRALAAWIAYDSAPGQSKERSSRGAEGTDPVHR